MSVIDSIKQHVCKHSPVENYIFATIGQGNVILMLLIYLGVWP